MAKEPPCIEVAVDPMPCSRDQLFTVGASRKMMSEKENIPHIVSFIPGISIDFNNCGCSIWKTRCRNRGQAFPVFFRVHVSLVRSKDGQLVVTVAILFTRSHRLQDVCLTCNMSNVTCPAFLTLFEKHLSDLNGSSWEDPVHSSGFDAHYRGIILQHYISGIDNPPQ